MPEERVDSGFDLKLSVIAQNDPINPVVYPNALSIKIEKEQKFEVKYDCKQLLDKGKTYYDTIRVILSEGESAITFEYLIVCDPSQLRSFDLNFVMLFVIAISVVVISIKTPPLLIFREMTQEE